MCGTARTDRLSERERLRLTSQALEEAEQRCQLLLANSTAAIAYVHEGMHIYANEGYIQLFGFDDADDMVGLPLMDLLDETSASRVRSALKSLRHGTGNGTDGGAGDAAPMAEPFEFEGKTTSGTTLTGVMTLSAAEYEGESCVQVTVKTVPRVTENLPAATVPGESGGSALVDLRTLCEDIDAHRPTSDDTIAVLIAFRIDRFTPLMREHGLDAASQLASRVLSAAQTCNPGRLVWQVDGQNFITSAVLEDAEAAVDLAEQLRSDVQDLIVEVSGRTLRTSITLVIEPLKENATVGKVADHAIAQLIDAEGATNTVIYKNRPKGEASVANGDSGDVIELINHAIENQKFLLLYQPVISLRGDSDEHYEVFLRMLDREGNEMVPDQFLKTAIEHGVAGKIDRWVVLQAIKTLSMHRAKGHSTRITINLTQNSIADSEFTQWLSVAIKAARLPVDAVIFQVTEDDALNDLPVTIAFLEQLHSLHCQASLSQFGRASDSMDVLKKLPVEYVKVAGSYVEAMEDDGTAREDLQKLVRTLQSRGLLTIVPMVETANMLSVIWQAGANYIQGHYLQEPTTEMDYDFSTDDD